MPSIASHMAVAKLVGEELNIYNEEFIRGNLLPDIINKEDAHHKIKYQEYLIPDISYFVDKLNLINSRDLGYLTHLLLDKLFLVNYRPDVMGFISRKIYHDYDIINYILVKEFKLDVPYLNLVLNNFKEDINIEKLICNIRDLNNPMINEKTTYLDINTFIPFLYHSSSKISTYLRRIRK